MKTYHMYNADCISAEGKLKEAEKQEEKQIGRSVKQDDRMLGRSPDPAANVRFEEKHQRRSSVRKIEKMKEKAKYTENKLKAMKARNEYILALEATNSSVFKYYIHDLNDLLDVSTFSVLSLSALGFISSKGLHRLNYGNSLDSLRGHNLIKCCDLGYHASLNRAMRTFLSAEINVEQSKHEGLEIIENAIDNLDASNDKQRLMELYHTVFCLPPKFDFQSHMGDG
eukprot:g39743.t1